MEANKNWRWNGFAHLVQKVRLQFRILHCMSAARYWHIWKYWTILNKITERRRGKKCLYQMVLCLAFAKKSVILSFQIGRLQDIFLLSKSVSWCWQFAKLLAALGSLALNASTADKNTTFVHEVVLCIFAAKFTFFFPLCLAYIHMKQM